MVVVLLAILSVVALPRFLNIGKDARINAMKGLYSEIIESVDQFRLSFIVKEMDMKYSLSRCRSGTSSNVYCTVRLNEISDIISCPNSNDRFYVGFHQSMGEWSTLSIPSAFDSYANSDGGLLSCLMPGLPYMKGSSYYSLPDYDAVQQASKEYGSKFVVVQVGNSAYAADFAILAVDRVSKDDDLGSIIANDRNEGC